MQIQTLPLDSLNPDPRNARTHDERNLGEIVASLRRWGQYRPFVVQREGMIIRVGNGMYAGMLQLGWTEGQAIVMDLSDREAEALAVMDNRSAELAGWDYDTLADILDELPEELSELTGFRAGEIEDLLAAGDPEWDEEPPPEEDAASELDPAGTTCAIGEYRFPVTRPDYDRLVIDLTAAAGHAREDVIAEIQRRLGL